MSVKEVNNTLQFLKRVELKGTEVEAYCEVQNILVKSLESSVGDKPAVEEEKIEDSSNN